MRFRIIHKNTRRRTILAMNISRLQIGSFLPAHIHEPGAQFLLPVPYLAVIGVLAQLEFALDITVDNVEGLVSPRCDLHIMGNQ